MIENLRKYTVVIFIVIVALLIGFTFMDTGSMFQGVGGGGTRISVAGRNYSPAQFVELGSGPLQLASQLQSYDINGLEIMRFTNTLVQNPSSRSNAEVQFFVSRVLLQDAFKKYGIHPSEQAIDDFVRALSIFQRGATDSPTLGGSGEFSQEQYNSFATKTLPYLGLSEQVFRELIRDVIATSKLRRLLGGGLPGSPTLAKNMILSNEQKITADLASVDILKVRESLDPTTDELKEYWENTQQRYRTEPRAKITYLYVEPNYSDEAKPAEQDGQETTETDAKQAQQAERKKTDRVFAEDLNEFYEQLTASEGSKFEQLAQERNWQLVTTDWITPSTLPEDLQQPTRGTWAERQVSTVIFDLKKGSDPLAAYTLPISIDEHAWLIIRLDDSEDSRVKTYEEAAAEVRDDFLNEKSDEIVRRQVDETIEDMEKQIKAGKSFAEVAKEHDLETREYGPYGANDAPVSETRADEIFRAAATVNPGNFAKPLFHEDEAIIIYVTNREIVKNDDRSAQIDIQLANMTQYNENAIFTAWLNQEIENAHVIDPFANQ